ncbi:hypothetical protein HY441_00885 [Candidatus Microgenomates bacterium]|nr:hypothetical protein [Candidatus Microgenomates bacterium]
MDERLRQKPSERYQEEVRRRVLEDPRTYAEMVDFHHFVNPPPDIVGDPNKQELFRGLDDDYCERMLEGDVAKATELVSEILQAVGGDLSQLDQEQRAQLVGHVAGELLVARRQSAVDGTTGEAFSPSPET